MSDILSSQVYSPVNIQRLVCACECMCIRARPVWVTGESDAQPTRQMSKSKCHYVLASLSRIDKIIGLFRKRALHKRQYSAKETCNFIDPTDRSHPIVG